MLSNRLIHVHIPKTAGSALRLAIQRAGGKSLRIFAKAHERNFKDIDPNQYDLFSGHIGFETATGIGGDLITVLRNPIDRFLSVYYFWRQLHAEGVEVSPKTICAAKYSLDDFVRINDEPLLIEEFFNRATWQIACGSSFDRRRAFRAEGRTERDLLRAAKRNLAKFSVVGLQESLDGFVDDFFCRYGLRLAIQERNVTRNRETISDVSPRTLRKIHTWVYLDVELYSHLVSMKKNISRAVDNSNTESG